LIMCRKSRYFFRSKSRGRGRKKLIHFEEEVDVQVPQISATLQAFG
jgi:hypothetical protein